jgi:hypothetical protein
MVSNIQAETKTGYLGNPLLKGVGLNVGWTPDTIEEYIKCSKDPVYFVQRYVKIVHLDRGLVPFDLWPFQENMVKTFHENRFTIAKLPRQSGKTTTVIAYFLWFILFNEDVTIAILANKGSLARDILGRLQLAYENLPGFLQQGIKVWNRGDIHLENGSKVIAASTSSSAIRGGSYNMILLDEFAFVPKNIAEEFFSSVYPTISSGASTKVIIVSTPCGMNHFYKLWTDSCENRNHYVPIEVHWSEVPGRDVKWKQETIANTSKDQFRQEFECEFIGSVNTLITPAKLRTLAYVSPIEARSGLDIYELPKEGRIYTMVCDVSHGEGLDYSAFSVIDSTELPYKQVAKYRSSNISPLLYPNIIIDVANKYNEAYVLVETNDIGQQVGEILHGDLEYENLMMLSTRGRAGQVLTGGFGPGKSHVGIRTSKKVKQIGCQNFKNLIEDEQLIIQDFDTISEMTSFVAKGTSYQAEAGYHDDLVMTLVLFSWVALQPYFKEMNDVDVRKRLYDNKMQVIEDDVLPFGFTDDGVTIEDKYVDNDGQVWHVVDP